MKYSTRSLCSSWLFAASFAAAPLFLTLPARAEGQAEAKSQPEAARRAQAAYDVQDFATAIKEYRVAYQVEQRPELLWGLAQSLRMSGDCKSAIMSYKAYRRSEVSANQSTAAELMITRCEAELSKQEAEAAKSAASSQPAPAPAPAPAAAEPATRREEAPVAPVREPKRFYQDALGDVLFVAGAAAAGVGGYFLFKGNSEVKSGNDADTYTDHTDSVDAGKKKQTLGAVALGAGGALLVGATVRFLTFDPGPNDRISVGLGSIAYRTQF